MSPETWAKLLYTYGPFALLVFLVFVIYQKIYSAWREAKQGNQSEQTVFLWLYGLTWIVILGVAIYSVYAWYRINLAQRPQITGTIESLSNLETLGTTFADLYLHKNPKGGEYSDYDLLLINKDEKWPAGAKVKFTIQAPSPTSQDGDLFEYELTIQSDFYETGVVLRRRGGKLILDHNGQEQELKGELLPRNAQPNAARLGPSWEIVPTAHAQTMQPDFSKEDFTVGLESPDAIVRRKTRYDLSLQDQTIVVPWIDSVLQDPTSSYRLRLGVLVALNNMPNLPAESLLPATIAAIQENLNNRDDALRNEALGLARKYKLIPVTVFEDINYKGRWQAYGPGIYRADKLQLGSLPNDSASSVRVASGFSVRLCEHEEEGKGGGVCVTRGAGSYQLHSGLESVADKVSFVQVFKLKKDPVD